MILILINVKDCTYWYLILGTAFGDKWVIRNSSFLGSIIKKYSVQVDSPASCGGEETYLKYVSLRLRQQCQFLMLALNNFLRRN